MISPNQSIHATNPNEKKAFELIKNELKTTKQLLSLQQQDNYKYQEHVKILDAEIDALHTMIENKQHRINKLNDHIKEKDDRIKELNELLYDNKVDRHAFKSFEHQNLLLLDELKDKKMRMENLEIEVRYLRDLYDNKNDSDTNKIINTAERDIILTNMNNKLKQDVIDCMSKLQEKDIRIKYLNDNIEQLKVDLSNTKEMFHNQILRSRSSEYNTLYKLQQLSDQYYTIQDEKEMIQDTVALQNSNNKKLLKQLVYSMDKLDQSQEYFGSIIDQVEVKTNLSIKNEKILIEENEKLQLEIQLLKLNLNNIQNNSKHKLTLTERYDEYIATQTQHIKEEKNINKSKINDIDYSMNRSNSTSKVLNTKRSNNNKYKLSNNQIIITSNKEKKKNEQQMKISDLINTWIENKTNWIEKYMNIFISGYQNNDNTHNSIISSNVILDLAHSQINDQDINLIISWLRKISSQYLQTINLNDNDMSIKGILKIITWLLSEPDEVLLHRLYPLDVLIRNNKLSDHHNDIIQIKQLLDNTLSKSNYQIVHRDDIDDSNVIYVYTNPGPTNMKYSQDVVTSPLLPQINTNTMSNRIGLSPNKHNQKHTIVSNNSNHDTNPDLSKSKLILRIDMNVIIPDTTSVLSDDDDENNTKEKDYIYKNIDKGMITIHPLTAPANSNQVLNDIWCTSDDYNVSS